MSKETMIFFKKGEKSEGTEESTYRQWLNSHFKTHSMSQHRYT